MFKLDGKATYSSLGLISKQASAQYEWKLSIILWTSFVVFIDP